MTRNVGIARVAPLLLALAALTACGDGSSGSFTIGELTEDEAYAEERRCLEAMFPFEPGFLTARERQGSVGLFMQSEGGDFQKTDVIYIEVFESAEVDDGDTVTMTRPGGLDDAAVGELVTGTSCPDLVQSFYVLGDIEFRRFNSGQDGIIEGRLVGASLWSDREGMPSEIAGSLEGQWLIEVRTGQPYEEFYVIQ